jgi:hypothetical protein
MIPEQPLQQLQHHRSSSTYPQCRENLTINTFPQLHEWTQRNVPLLQSVVEMEKDVFNIIFLVKHLPLGKASSWASKRWFCGNSDGGGGRMMVVVVIQQILLPS